MSLFGFYISDLEVVMQLTDRVGARVKDQLSSENWLRWETIWFRVELRLLVTEIKFTHQADVQ